MGRTYHKLDYAQREFVWEQKERGIKGPQIAAELAAGKANAEPPIHPVKITPQAINSVYRTMKLERNQLYYAQIATVRTDDLLARNRRKLSEIAAAELERLRQKQERGELDGEQLRKLAGAIERIEKLEIAAARREPMPDPKRKPRGSEPPKDGDQEQDEAPSFAESLLAEAAKREAENPHGEAVEDGSANVPREPVPTSDLAPDSAKAPA